MFAKAAKKTTPKLFTKNTESKLNQFVGKQSARKHFTYPKTSFFSFSVFILIQTAFSVYSILINDAIHTNIKTLHSLIRIAVSLILIFLWYICLHFERKRKIKQSTKLEVVITLLWAVSSIYLDLVLMSHQTSNNETNTQYDDLRSGFQFFEGFYVMTILFKQKTSKMIYLVLAVTSYATVAFKRGETLNGFYLLFTMIFNIFLIYFENNVFRSEMSQQFKVRQEGKKHRNILFLLPESVMTIDLKGNVKFTNSLMRNKFLFDGNTLEEDFLESFGELRYREHSYDYNFKASASSILYSQMRTLRSLPTRKYTLTRKGTLSVKAREELHAALKEVKSLQGLVDCFIANQEAWQADEEFFFIFDTKFFQKDVNIRLSVEIRASIFSNGDNTQLVMAFRDTTERDRIATLEVENITFRNNVLASFSHELRTPLNANLAFLEQSLNSIEVSKKVKENLLMPAMVSSRLLLSLVDDILDFSQFIIGKLAIRSRAAEIRDTIESCMKLFRDQAKSKGLNLVLSVDESVPKLFFTDHQRLSQILINLLSNAIKFTFTGTVKVTFEDVNEGMFQLSVSDTGLGLTKEEVDRLKDRLSHGELKDKLNSGSSGIGMGLFIAQTLSMLITGKLGGIKVVSEYGKGTTASFMIEYHEVLKFSDSSIDDSLAEEFSKRDDVTPMKVREYKTEFNAKKKSHTKFRFGSDLARLEHTQEKVLIVDDEVFNIMVLENYCKEFNIQTERAFNGRDAIEKIKELKKGGIRVRVVLLDVNMPIMNGYETSEALNRMTEEGELDEVKIIGVTAYVAPDMIAKCYECGFSSVVNKPVSKEMVKKVLKSYNVII